jgi:predicted kinase
MIEVLVGMIASGKSSWAKDRADAGWIIINDDSIVSAVHAQDYLLYNEALKPLYKSIEDHTLHTAVAMGKDVVIDRGVDVSTSSRQRWIALGRSLDVPVRAVLFEVFSPEIHAQRRVDSDARGHDYDYWLNSVAKPHLARYQEPTTDEGFSDIILRNWT